MKNFKVLVKKANIEMEKLVKFLEEHTGLYEGRNLKLYDISWNQELQDKWNLTDEQYSDLFYWYCEQEYDFFIEWMKEEGINKNVMNYWGMTSTFDLTNSIIETDRRSNLDYGMTVYNIACNNTIGCNDLNYIIDGDGKIKMELITRYCKKGNKYWLEENIRDLKEGLEYIASGEMFNDFMNDMQDSIEIDKYLNSFMENQVENFEDFIQHEIEENGFLA